MAAATASEEASQTSPASGHMQADTCLPPAFWLYVQADYCLLTSCLALCRQTPVCCRLLAGYRRILG